MTEPPPDDGDVTIVWHTTPAKVSRFAVLTRKPVLIALAAVVVVVGLIVGFVLLPRTRPAADGQPATAGSPSDPAPTVPATSAPGSTPTPAPASTCRGAGIGTGFWVDQTTVLTSYPAVAEAVSLAVVGSDGTPA